MRVNWGHWTSFSGYRFYLMGINMKFLSDLWTLETSKYEFMREHGEVYLILAIGLIVLWGYRKYVNRKRK